MTGVLYTCSLNCLCQCNLFSKSPKVGAGVSWNQSASFLKVIEVRINHSFWRDSFSVLNINEAFSCLQVYWKYILIVVAVPSKRVRIENDFQRTFVKLEILIEVYRAINYYGFTERETFSRLHFSLCRPSVFRQSAILSSPITCQFFSCATTWMEEEASLHNTKWLIHVNQCLHLRRFSGQFEQCNFMHFGRKKQQSCKEHPLTKNIRL